MREFQMRAKKERINETCQESIKMSSHSSSCSKPVQKTIAYSLNEKLKMKSRKRDMEKEQ